MLNSLRAIPIPEQKATAHITGKDGNAFEIMFRASTGMKRAGYSAQLIEQYQKECLAASSYDQMLLITMDYVDDDPDADWEDVGYDHEQDPEYFEDQPEDVDAP